MPKPMKEGGRSFVMLASVPSFSLDGRYTGKTPVQAAQHAAHEVFNANPGRNVVFIKIRETTRVRKSDKPRMYRVTRIERPKDEQVAQSFVKEDGKAVTFTAKFRYVTKAVTDEAEFGKV